MTMMRNAFCYYRTWDSKKARLKGIGKYDP